MAPRCVRFKCFVLAISACSWLTGCGPPSDPDYVTTKLDRFGDSGMGAGQIRYARTSQGQWELAVELEELQPGQRYCLALNALVPDSPESKILGNLKLDGWPEGDFYHDPEIGQEEGYWDFETFNTRDDGTFSKTYRLPLPVRAGEYALKFLVKEHYGIGDVVLQSKSVRCVVQASSKARAWQAAGIAAGLLAVVAAISIGLIVRRRRKAANHPVPEKDEQQEEEGEEEEADETGDPPETRLEVDLFQDLGIGIQFDRNQEKNRYWAMPCPQWGDLFAESQAVELNLPGSRWKVLLEHLAASKQGTLAQKDGVMTALRYSELKDVDRFTWQRQQDRRKKAHARLSNAATDMSRKLRQACKTAGVIVKHDERGSPPISVKSETHVETKFVVRFLLEMADGRVHFGDPSQGD